MPARWRRGAVGDVLTAQLGFDEFLGERVLVTVDLNTAADTQAGRAESATRRCADRHSIRTVRRSPGLRQYSDAFPRDSGPHVENFIYWSKEAFGMKPVIAATHTTIWRGTGGTGDATILAKQIYASHYLDASISLTVLMKDGRPEPRGVFVVYQNRSLVDLLQGGFLGPLRRSIARSRTKDGLAGQLEGLKKRLEAEYKSTGGK